MDDPLGGVQAPVDLSKRVVGALGRQSQRGESRGKPRKSENCRMWPARHSPSEPLVMVITETIMDDLVGMHVLDQTLPSSLCTFVLSKLSINPRKELSAPFTEEEN